MSEEELKAIEDLNEMVIKSRNLREEEFYKLIGIHNIQSIATVLNLIEKQQKELDTYKKMVEKLAYEILVKIPFCDTSEENIEILIEGIRKEAEKDVKN